METQCSIIGTCLSIKELRKLARQNDLELKPEAGDFEIHVVFVSICSECNQTSKAVNKYLDRKYAGAVRKYSKAKNDAELMLLWRESRTKGDIPGPYWALMTHPEASVDLRNRAFGDVHMLSHLAGANNRADIRRLSDLEEQLEKVHENRAKTRSAYRKRLKAVLSENKDLKDRVAVLAKEAVAGQFKSKKYCNQAVILENQALQRSLATQSLFLSEEQARVDALSRRLQAYEERMEHLRDELREKNAEVEFLEVEIQRTLERQRNSCGCKPGACGCEKAGTPDCPGPDLCGKRILYVGGRHNLVQHYRQVVEHRGGEFIHHDGGVEQTRQVLPKMLSGVDAVLCPVDCVSHDACQCVKEVCKYTMKPCMFLRSSGLSSLVKSLMELTETSKLQGGQ
jgi:hypothetical protein